MYLSIWQVTVTLCKSCFKRPPHSDVCTWAESPTGQSGSSRRQQRDKSSNPEYFVIFFVENRYSAWSLKNASFLKNSGSLKNASFLKNLAIFWGWYTPQTPPDCTPLHLRVYWVLLHVRRTYNKNSHQLLILYKPIEVKSACNKKMKLRSDWPTIFTFINFYFRFVVSLLKKMWNWR